MKYSIRQKNPNNHPLHVKALRRPQTPSERERERERREREKEKESERERERERDIPRLIGHKSDSEPDSFAPNTIGFSELHTNWITIISQTVICVVILLSL